MSEEYEGEEGDIASFDEIGAMVDRFRSADSPEAIDFRRFFAGLATPPQHFIADEFMVLGPSNATGGRCAGRNSLPPRDLWENAVDLFAAMDAIRATLGYPVRITNCYRAPEYNSCVGGVSRSQHLRFRAADFVCRDGVSADWAAAARKVRDAGIFSGGIGLYNSFVHVDVRGSAADWDNR